MALRLSQQRAAALIGTPRPAPRPQMRAAAWPPCGRCSATTNHRRARRPLGDATTTIPEPRSTADDSGGLRRDFYDDASRDHGELPREPGTGRHAARSRRAGSPVGRGPGRDAPARHAHQGERSAASAAPNASDTRRSAASGMPTSGPILTPQMDTGRRGPRRDRRSPTARTATRSRARRCSTPTPAWARRPWPSCSPPGSTAARSPSTGRSTAEGHQRVPVAYIGLTSNTSMRSLNSMLCRFYGHPGAERGNATQLANRAADCVLVQDPPHRGRRRPLPGHEPPGRARGGQPLQVAVQPVPRHLRLRRGRPAPAPASSTRA